MKRKMAAGFLSAAMISSLLAGCGSSGSADGTGHVGSSGCRIGRDDGGRYRRFRSRSVSDNVWRQEF